MHALAADGPLSGVQIDVAGKKLSASHEAITTIVGGLERMWSRTLDWAEDNPIQFALVVVLVAFIVLQRRLGRREVAAMIAHYETHREKVRNQEPPLPLPPPAPKE